MGPRVKPCLHEYGHPKEICPGCRSTLRRDFRWYIPFYATAANIPTVAAIGSGATKLIDALELHQYVTVRRGPRDTDPLFVVPMTKQVKFQPSAEEQDHEQDICRWLVVMWEYQEYLHHDQIRSGPIRGASEEPATVLTDRGLLPEQVSYAIEQPGEDKASGLTRDEVNERAVRKWKREAKPISNGTHHD